MKSLGRAGAIFFAGIAFLLPTLALAAPVQCECVRALRELRGVNIRGDAWTIGVNKPLRNANVGDVLLFDYGGKGKDHGALIIGFEGETASFQGAVGPRYIRIWECNYDRCKCGERLIRWDEPELKGVFSPLSTGLF
jgi:hypothetical protein